MRRVWAPAFVFVAIVTRAVAQVPAGGELRLHTFTNGNQERPAIAFGRNGDFLAVWFGPRAGNGAILGQRYSALGARLGGEFQVNGTPASGYSAIATATSGDFIVVWEGRDGANLHGIFGRVVAPSGALVGAQLPISATTGGAQSRPSIGVQPGGAFVVAWDSDAEDGENDVFGRRFTSAGQPVGVQFRVNSWVPSWQYHPQVASDPGGRFVVAWASVLQDGSYIGVFGQRFDADGSRIGGEFQVNQQTTGDQSAPHVAADAAGRFVVAWPDFQYQYPGPSQATIHARRYDAFGIGGPEFQVDTPQTTYAFEASVSSARNGAFVVAWDSVFSDGSNLGIVARRYDEFGAPGAALPVNSFTVTAQDQPMVTLDEVGNFVVAWRSDNQDPGPLGAVGVYAQRYGGLLPAVLGVDPSSSPSSDGNGVLEPGEEVGVEPAWRNVNGASQTFDGQGSSFGGPGGPAYTLVDGAAGYGTVPNDSVGACGGAAGCYVVSVTGPRPVVHWDSAFREDIVPPSLGQSKTWTLHIGDSFADVPRASPFYGAIEAMLHHAVTAGCALGRANSYCPSAPLTREQMAPFLLLAKQGAGYAPPPCQIPGRFTDVPAGHASCPWIEELARRGVVTGCTRAMYCPSAPVSREEIALFLLRTLVPSAVPPPCVPPNVYNDVPETSPYCPWIEELAARGVLSDCGGGNYCPAATVSREQMAFFVTATFGLTLYGP